MIDIDEDGYGADLTLTCLESKCSIPQIVIGKERSFNCIWEIRTSLFL